MSWNPIETISGITQHQHKKKLSTPNIETVKSGCVKKPFLSSRSLLACQNQCPTTCSSKKSSDPCSVVCPKFKLKIETSDTQTGPVIDGPVTVRSGDTVRFWSEGGLQMNVVEGSALVQMEPANILMTPGGAPVDPPTDPTRPMIYVDPIDGSVYVWNPDTQQYNDPISSSGGGGGGTGIDGLNAVVTNSVCSGEDNLALAPVASLSDNASISLGPRGNGFISSRFPDNTSYGGDCRGLGSVDFQIKRQNADQVASGQYSVICGGYSNKCAQNASVVCGGFQNDNSPISAGYSSNFSSCIVGGNGNVNTSMLSFIGGGYRNQMHGTGFSVLGSIVNGVYNRILDGTYCSTILNGEGNQLNRSSFSLIGSGSDNLMLNARSGVILAGDDNGLTGCSGAFIGNGRINVISTSNFGLICNGTGNLINGVGRNNSIINGTNNQIRGTSHSCIVSGYNHSIIHNNNVIIGGTGIGSTGANEIHLGTTTKIHKVANDQLEEKFLVWNSTTKEVKYRDTPILRGFAELAAGTVNVTIPNPPGITNNHVIVATHRFPISPANMGILYISNVTSNSFTINSTNVLDGNWTNWMAILSVFPDDT